MIIKHIGGIQHIPCLLDSLGMAQWLKIGHLWHSQQELQFVFPKLASHASPVYPMQVFPSSSKGFPFGILTTTLRLVNRKIHCH